MLYYVSTESGENSVKLNQKLILIVGMNGAGKKSALNDFGEMGYFCVDNLPVHLIKHLISTVRDNSDIKKAAAVINLQRANQFKPVAKLLNSIVHKNEAKVIFMDASDQQLIARYKEHRHSHPLSPYHRVVDGIAEERRLNRPLKQEATILIGTTNLKPTSLKQRLNINFPISHKKAFHIDVMSFGFKYGMPLDADIVEDVRFLPNPFYIQKLRHQNGLDADVYNYVMDKPMTQEFCRKFIDLLKFSIPGYIKEGKPNLTIAIGCTGGQHRSVTVARKVAEVLSHDYPVNVYHRDVKKSYQEK